MVDNKLGMPQLPSVVPPAEETFQSMDYGDMWAEAQMASVCRYGLVCTSICQKAGEI